LVLSLLCRTSASLLLGRRNGVCRLHASEEG
jgi:hypothetical protein